MKKNLFLTLSIFTFITAISAQADVGDTKIECEFQRASQLAPGKDGITKLPEVKLTNANVYGYADVITGDKEISIKVQKGRDAGVAATPYWGVNLTQVDSKGVQRERKATLYGQAALVSGSIVIMGIENEGDVIWLRCNMMPY